MCSIKGSNDNVILLLSSVATVGLEYTNYLVIESEECVEICFTFTTEREDCSADFKFSVNFSAFADSAGRGGR